MIKITDKSFHYTPSYNTDLKKKFRRMAQERRKQEEKQAQSSVITLHKGKNK